MEYNVVFFALLVCVVFNEVSCIFATDWHFSGPNIALRKPASQLPGTYENYTADLAVDGNADTDVTHGSCSHTSGSSFYNRSHEAQWVVDLKGNFYVTGIIIINRKLFCNLMKISDGHMSPVKNESGVNETAFISCNEGFRPKNQEITCNNIGNWSRYINCSRIKCSYTGEPANGYYIIEPFSNGHVFSPYLSLPYESIISVKCDLGYETSSNTLRQCQSNGTWSDILNKGCKKKQCLFPGDINDGEYQFQNGSFYSAGNSFYNTTVRVRCKKGFTIQGSKERTCDANKTWGNESFCKINVCDFPYGPKNGIYATKGNNGNLIPILSGQLKYQDKLYIICPKGYVLNSASQTRQCLEANSWSGEAGQCNLVTCQNLEELKDGYYNYTDDPFFQGYPFDTVVTAECNEPFRLSNSVNKSRRCTETGVWDNEPSVCISVTADNIEQDNKATLIGSLSSVVFVIVVSLVLAALLLYRRKLRKLKRQSQTNVYTDLTINTRNAESEYSDIQLAQLAGNASIHVQDTSHTREKEDPDYYNTQMKR